MAADALRRVLGGEVDRDVGRAAGQRFRQLAQPLLAPRHQHQLGAGVAGEPDCRRLSDPRRRSRYKCDCHVRNSIRDGGLSRTATPHHRHPPRRRAGDAAGALFRPRLRSRDHPVHGADVARPDLVGAGQGLLILAVLWWAWVGYAWLTSVIDPEALAIRGVIFLAMAALLIVAICVQEAFDNLALTFALGIGVFRAAHIALFMLAGAEADGDDLRHSVIGLGISTAIAVGILALASLFDGLAQGALWALAIFLDMGGP